MCELFTVIQDYSLVSLVPTCEVSQECQELILRLLAYNPEERLSARQALKSGCALPM